MPLIVLILEICRTKESKRVDFGHKIHPRRRERPCRRISQSQAIGMAQVYDATIRNITSLLSSKSSGWRHEHNTHISSGS